MTTRREFVSTVGAVAAAAIIPLKFAEAEPFFDAATMATHAYPLSTPIRELYDTGVGGDSYNPVFTQRIVDYLQKESIEAYLVNYPTILIAGEPLIAKTRKLKCRVDGDFSRQEQCDSPYTQINPKYFESDPKQHDYIAEGVAKEFAWEIRERAKGSDHFHDGPRSVGILGFLMTPVMYVPDVFCARRGVMVRYLTSTTSAREVLRFAELTKRNKIPPSGYKWTNA